MSQSRQTHRRPARRLVVVGALAGTLFAAAAAIAEPELPPRSPAGQLEAYRARCPKTVLELQPFRSTTRIEIQGAAGRRGTATLIDLAPQVHAWLLLELAWSDGQREGPFHLENVVPGHQRIRLEAGFPSGLVLASERGTERCELWSDATSALAAARAGGRVYAPLCGERLYVRNHAVGRKTALEWTTDFLRDYVWQGEEISNFVREHFYQDAFLTTSELVTKKGAAFPELAVEDAPLPARVDPDYGGALLRADELGIELDAAGPELEVGRWYRAKGTAGVFGPILRNPKTGLKRRAFF